MVLKGVSVFFFRFLLFGSKCKYSYVIVWLSGVLKFYFYDWNNETGSFRKLESIGEIVERGLFGESRFYMVVYDFWVYFWVVSV